MQCMQCTAAGRLQSQCQIIEILTKKIPYRCIDRSLWWSTIYPRQDTKQNRKFVQVLSYVFSNFVDHKERSSNFGQNLALTSHLSQHTLQTSVVPDGNYGIMELLSLF